MINKLDLFISHASEDKKGFVRPLAETLRNFGIEVWYDEFSLQLGDSISKSIDRGLVESKYGLVVISPSFISKPWPEYELRGLITREIGEEKIILPIWHGVTRKQVIDFSPPLADRFAFNTRNDDPKDIAIKILKIVRPDIYEKHRREDLESIASGRALYELQDEIEKMNAELEKIREELSQFQCPYCNSLLSERTAAPVDPGEKHWDAVEIYECGYEVFGGAIQRPCPSDPRFPKLEEYKFEFKYQENEPILKWICYATASSRMQKHL